MYQVINGKYQWVPSANDALPTSTPTYSDATTGTGPIDQNPGSSSFGQPITTGYNQSMFASDATAQQWAQALGGNVVNAPLMEAGGGTPDQPWTMPNANYIVLPNGSVVNAGTVATLAQHFGGVNNALFQQALSQAINMDAGAAQNPTQMGGAAYWYNQYTPASSVPTVKASEAARSGAAAGAGDAAVSGGAQPANASNVGRVTAAQATAGGLPSRAVYLNSNRTGLTSGTDVTTSGAATPTGRFQGNTAGAGSAAGSAPQASAKPNALSISNVPNYYDTSGGAYAGAGAGAGTAGGGAAVAGAGAAGSSGAAGSGYSGYTPAAYNANFPIWSAGDGTGNQAYVGGDPGYMASALQNRALDYGNNFQNMFGQAYQNAMGQSQAYQSQADKAYNDLYANPGFTSDESNNILQADLLKNATTTADQYASNFLTPAEQAAMAGNPSSVVSAYNPSNITGAAATGQSNVNAALGTYGTNLRGTVDPTKLGISDAQVQQLKDQAGRQVGLNYAAQEDQLQRQAEAAGNVNPLAISAARQRLDRQSAIDNADAVTNADISATGAQRAANTTIAQMQQANENALGSANVNSALNLSGQNIAAQEAAGNMAINQAQYADTNAANRAASIATNRQNTAQANQQNAYQQGYNSSNALSGRYQTIAGQRIQGQQAARNYWQGQGQYQGSQGNTAGNQMVSGAQTALNAQAQGGNIAMGTEIGRRGTRPVNIGTGGISIGV